MNRSILVSIVTLSCALTAFSQQIEKRATTQASGASTAAVSQSGKNFEITSGTRVTGELQNTIDVSKAEVGDQVVLKTTRAIKSGGQTLVGKGAKLIGRVTEVTRKTKDNAGSSLGLVFDRLEDGSLTIPISVTISSINSAGVNARTDNDPFASDATLGSSSSARTSTASGSGGLIGGVTTTAGGVLSTTTAAAAGVAGATTSAVGSTVDATTNAVGATANGIGRSIGRIRISESSSTSAEGGAVLSLQGDNIRLEKGTNFNLILNQSATANTAPEN